MSDTVRDALLRAQAAINDAFALDAANTTPPAPKPGGRAPAEVLNLRNWKLTLPTTTSGKVTEIRQPKLATYTDRYFAVTDADDGVQFRVWHGGDTTQNSKNPRSELREMTSDGSDEFDWSTKSGRHTCEIVGQVNRLTKVKPHVVIGQIHGGDDDLTVWRVEGSKLYLTKGDNTHAYLVDGAFQLGKRYTIKFDVSGGKVTYYYNGTKVPFTVTSSDTSAFFKAGCYAQTNPTTAPTESTDEYDEVVIYSVQTTHTA